MDELQKSWSQHKAFASSDTIDKTSLGELVNSSVKRQKNITMRYFWAFFTFQIIVYAFLAYVIVRYGSDTPLLLVSIFGALLYLPFTVVLMKKFKRMAVLKPDRRSTIGMAIREYVAQQYTLLASFYQFKKRYEFVLIPLSSAIMIWIIFRLYVPGGMMAFPFSAFVCFLITLGACSLAISAENWKYFQQPLARLEEVRQDLKHDDE